MAVADVCDDHHLAPSAVTTARIAPVVIMLVKHRSGTVACEQQQCRGNRSIYHRGNINGGVNRRNGVA